jgi:acyl phosphate:glycerol-3-phosphate acyltransferase
VETAAFVVAGYLCGSLTFGYWLVRIFRGEDIRTKGSGNVGATNVWRVYGPQLGLPAAVLDVAKGFAPAFAATVAVGHGGGVLAGAAAMLGHWRPIFLGFQKGGKMVATAGGATFALAPLVAFCCVGVWLVVFLLTRFASLASIVTALALAVLVVVLGYPWPIVVFGVAGASAVIALHHKNIRRLFAGTEHRFELRRARRVSG